MGRPDREGKRQVLIDKYGYDTKFAAHAYRLAIQGNHCMKYGEISPTLSTGPRTMALMIRAGELKKEEVIKLLETIDKKMYGAYTRSKLPEKPDFNKINDWLTDIHIEYFFPKEDYWKFHQL